MERGRDNRKAHEMVTGTGTLDSQQGPGANGKAVFKTDTWFCSWPGFTEQIKNLPEAFSHRKNKKKDRKMQKSDYLENEPQWFWN